MSTVGRTRRQNTDYLVRVRDGRNGMMKMYLLLRAGQDGDAFVSVGTRTVLYIPVDYHGVRIRE
jgi:hypothetical protein